MSERAVANQSVAWIKVLRSGAPPGAAATVVVHFPLQRDACHVRKGPRNLSLEGARRWEQAGRRC